MKRNLLTVLAFTAGLGAVTAGTAAIYWPAALILFGLFLVAVAWV